MYPKCLAIAQVSCKVLSICLGHILLNGTGHSSSVQAAVAVLCRSKAVQGYSNCFWCATLQVLVQKYKHLRTALLRAQTKLQHAPGHIGQPLRVDRAPRRMHKPRSDHMVYIWGHFANYRQLDLLSTSHTGKSSQQGAQVDAVDLPALLPEFTHLCKQLLSRLTPLKPRGDAHGSLPPTYFGALQLSPAYFANRDYLADSLKKPSRALEQAKSFRLPRACYFQEMSSGRGPGSTGVLLRLP